MAHLWLLKMQSQSFFLSRITIIVVCWLLVLMQLPFLENYSQHSVNIWFSFKGFTWNASFIWDMYFAQHWRAWKPFFIFATLLLTNVHCSFWNQWVLISDTQPDVEQLFMKVTNRNVYPWVIKLTQKNLSAWKVFNWKMRIKQTIDWTTRIIWEKVKVKLKPRGEGK